MQIHQINTNSHIYIKNNKKRNNINFKNNSNQYKAEKLIETLKMLYGKNTNDELLNNILNFILKYHKTIFNNSGSHAIFFPIPFIRDFGIRLERPFSKHLENTTKINFQEEKDLFPNHNYGQEVFTSNNGIAFLKKVDGTPSSVNNWHRFFCNPSLITPKEAQEYASKIDTVAQFPELAFQKLKDDIQNIESVNPYLIDSMNPNNFIINTQERTITPIDLHDTGEKTSTSLFHCMFNPLIDKLLYPKFLAKMDNKEESICRKNIDTIGNKIVDTIV